MDYLKISVITPSYNQAEYLEQTILSVINQQYPNLEYIIIDGGSTDGSVEIIKKYEKHLRHWESVSDNGQSAAINKGLKMATGDIVCWLNSDDLFFPDTLDMVNKTFQQRPDISLIYGNGEDFCNDGKKKDCISPEFNPINFLSKVTIPQPCVFWKKTIHAQIGYLDESFYYLMDYELWMRIFFLFTTLKVNHKFAKLRQHSKAKTANNPKGMYLEYRKVFSRFIHSIDPIDIGSSHKQQLQKLNLYDNAQEIKYKIANPPFNQEIKKILDNYIMNCAIQEYSWKNKTAANKLFFHCLSSHFLKSILFLIKNNFRF